MSGEVSRVSGEVSRVSGEVSTVHIKLVLTLIVLLRYDRKDIEDHLQVCYQTISCKC